jgi:hypothetical protein
VTLFVSDSNYSMAIIGLVDRKWLLLERLHGWRNSENHEFRKKSSFFQIPPIKKAMLRIAPTSLHPNATLKVNDYWCKCA